MGKHTVSRMEAVQQLLGGPRCSEKKYAGVNKNWEEILRRYDTTNKEMWQKVLPLEEKASAQQNSHRRN